MFETKMKKGKPMPGGGQQDRRQTICICLEIPALTKAVQDIVAYLNNRDHQNNQKIEEALYRIEKQGELILMTLNEFATRVDTATNAIAATLAELRAQLDPAGQAVLNAAITRLEGIAAGGQPVIPA